MHELDADRAAVGFPEDRDQLAQGAVIVRAELVVEDPVQVGLGEPKAESSSSSCFAAAGELQGVEVGQVVADLAVGVDQPGDGLDRLLRSAGQPSLPVPNGAPCD